MKLIDMATWPRREQFQLYLQLDFPYVGLCADVDVTALLAHCDAHGISSYRAIIYAILLVSDELPWLRQRIRDQQVVEHDKVNAGITGLSEQQQLRFSRIPFAPSWPEFDAKAKQVAAEIKASQSLFNASIDEYEDAVIYLSCMPWLRFTQFTHPVPIKPHCSIPRMGWGKYDKQGERTVMPLSLQVHHGIADGLHLADFYRRLEQRFATPEQWLS
ncbi:CatA-like O-acetyltransferase [Ferrimonas lipolytica]|uniref:Chloramphenicol O-acetyltransferase type A n=1 Tax=Ferrimonas lipolytica TaxID=2724191 RepID=A0A6H1UGL2_9GAMM|nr:CatA-like O-acetyltransferase [Ferrimonas lipolytica]QIZ77769.1 hypothetical protein HER31_13195 [Ferrimonas lipolytica]